jgi:predicted small secreted protein|tara:strand:- start:47 stop:163 length:117 start_codon:yes stop_codon:yes gene_type:complete
MKKISALLLLSAIALSGCSAPGTTSGTVASEPVSAGKL